MTLLEAALAYVNRGWLVFPCRPRGKEPLTGHGFKDAARLPLHINAWWIKWPTANIGIPTGPDTFDVLDVDGQAGLASLAELGIEPTGPRSRTGGGGLHLLYRGGTLSTSARKLPGLDTRSAGGYVIVPPSVGVAGSYEWILEPRPGEPLPDPPQALRELVAAPQGMNRLPGVKVDVSDPTHRAILRMAGIPLEELHDGERNVRLFKLGASLRARGSEGSEIRYILGLVNAILCKPPKSEREVSTIAASAARYAMSPEYQVHAEKIRQAEVRTTELEAAAEAKIEKTKAQVAVAAEKTAKQVAKEEAKIEEKTADAAVESAVLEAGTDIDVLRSLIADSTGCRVERVIQQGRDTPSYFLDLGSGEPIHVGSSLLSQERVGDAVARQRQNTGFADLSGRRWKAIRAALFALVVVKDDVEFERRGQTLAYLRDLYQSERGQRRLTKDAETVRRRLPYLESSEGQEWLYVSARGLQTHLQSQGTQVSYNEAGSRLAEAGCERFGSGVVSAMTEAGEQIRARYWGIRLKDVLERS